MPILEFEALLDDGGISDSHLARFRNARISGLELFAEYVNYLFVLGALRYTGTHFVRASSRAANRQPRRGK